MYRPLLFQCLFFPKRSHHLLEAVHSVILQSLEVQGAPTDSVQMHLWVLGCERNEKAQNSKRRGSREGRNDAHSPQFLATTLFLSLGAGVAVFPGLCVLIKRTAQWSTPAPPIFGAPQQDLLGLLFPKHITVGVRCSL